MLRQKTLETILTLVVALVIIGVHYKIPAIIYSAIGLGLVGLFINQLATIIHKLWMKLAEILGYISSRVLLSVIFFIFISPIAWLYRLFVKNVLQLKKVQGSAFYDRNHVYVKEDIEKIW